MLSRRVFKKLALYSTPETWAEIETSRQELARLVRTGKGTKKDAAEVDRLLHRAED